MSILPWVVFLWLMAIGVVGMATSRNYLHLIACLSVCQSSTYVLLLSIGFKWEAKAPIFHDHPPGTPVVDEVMQALVLTDVVVGAAVTALLLAMAIQVSKRRKTLDPQRLAPMHPPADRRS